MGRLVQPARLERVTFRGSVLESNTNSAVIPVGGDTYRDRIAKYIPGEVLAAYTSLDRMVVTDPKTFGTTTAKTSGVAAAAEKAAPTPSADPFHMALSWYMDEPIRLVPIVVLLVGLIFTPLYIRQLAIRTGKETAWRTQAVMSTLAFAVWAYAIQGGAFMSFYNGTVASAMLIIFTLASGLFEPAPLEDSSRS